MDKAAKLAASFGEYFIPKFIKECAQRGVQFETEEELTSGLEAAFLLGQMKTAAVQDQPQVNVKLAACNMLKQAAVEAGFTSQSESEEEVQTKTAAAQNIYRTLNEQ